MSSYEDDKKGAMEEALDLAKKKLVHARNVVESKIPLAVLPKLDKEPVSSTAKSRVMYAALGALSGLAASGVLVPFITRGKYRMSKPQIAATTLSMAFGSASFPEIQELAFAKKRGEISGKEASKRYSKLMYSANKVEEIKDPLERLYKSRMNKTAGAFGTAAKYIGKKMLKGTGTVAKEYGRAVVQRPWVGGLGERTFGLIAKGTAGYGLYRGGKAIYNRMGPPRSGANYTTFLRNQTLAGNIQPSELNQSDLISVRRLGLK